ncbi:MAG TPA: hypothetical protein VJ981_07050 [Gammaproteobacteria bacterium]|nr:hypothetical protein [Gammaproteobacteria bacterium]
MTGPDNDLPAEVRAALEAYQQMGQSKTTYFSLLQELDEKYKQGGEPSIAENLQLEKFLRSHDENVAAFSEAMQAVTDPEARELLLEKLSYGKISGSH